MLPDTLNIYIEENTFRLEPLFSDHRKSPHWAEIDRVTHTIKPVEAAVLSGHNVRCVHGVLGVLRLPSGPVLLVVTAKSAIAGRVRGHTLWRVNDVDYIRYNVYATPEEVQRDAEYVDMLKWLISTKTFIFSYSYDVTSSLQRQESLPFEKKGLPSTSNVNPDFMWNYVMCQDFLHNENMYEFILPVVQGFVEIRSELLLYGRSGFDLIVLTRRSRMRVGTRYNCRGINSDGDVANFCEVEQIVQSHGLTGSYVQVRGSIPLFWQQQVDIRYKPSITFPVQDMKNETSFVKHMDKLLQTYGKVVLVDLIDQNGAELALGNKFRSLVKAYKNEFVRYIGFDFHKECKGMQWGKLSMLQSDLMPDLENDGFFFLDSYGNTVRRQTGVIRTNCIDCLDRTNVIQSMLAKTQVTNILRYMGRLPPGERIEAFPDIDYTFMNVWADHADAISNMYAGSGALKTDFTRTGKRSLKGLIRDARCSMERYYYNNFVDGFKQDAMNLLVGKYQPSPYDYPPTDVVKEAEKKRLALIPIVGCTAVVMTILSLLYPHGSLERRIKHVGLWLCISLACWRLSLHFGLKIISRPKLVSDSGIDGLDFVPVDYVASKKE